MGIVPVSINLPLNTITSDLFPQSFQINDMQLGNVQMLSQIRGPMPVQQIHHQVHSSVQNNDIINLEICQQGGLIYTNMDASTEQQRLSRNQ